jgi:hypothetical protein
MATTTNYSWSTPDDTALVKDGAAAIRSLGTAIDTTVFTNAGAAIAKTIVDAKGDIIAATAADTVARLAVGANDTVLTADSSSATGLKWGTAAAGMTLISTTTLSGSSTTLSSIPATYNDLFVVIRNYKPDTNATDLLLRINGDSGANRHGRSTTYGDQFNGDFDATSVKIVIEQRESTTQSLFTITIPDYKNTTTYKKFFYDSVITSNFNTAKWHSAVGRGFYNQLDAISSLVFLPNQGNFTSGDVLLYGVK